MGYSGTGLKPVHSAVSVVDNYEYVPGTVHLVDLEGDLHVRKEDGNSDIILIPPPSSNPNDPLRWSKKKKQVQFWFLWWWAFFLAAIVNFSGPIYDTWVEVLNTNYNQLNTSSALCFLFLGVGCVFLQPTALKVGRRFVYMLCTFLGILSCTVGGGAQNVHYLYVSNIFGGLAAAPVDSLVEISVTDVFYKHEVGTYVSYMIFALYAGSYLGPVAAGFVVDDLSWRWTFWILTIIMGVFAFLQFFIMEDTTFYRDTNVDDVEDEILSQIQSRTASRAQSIDLDDHENDHGKSAEKVRTQAANNSVDADDSSIDYNIPKRSYVQRLKMIETEYNDPRSWFVLFLRPAFAYFPAVIYSALVYGSQMGWLSLLLVTQSQIYSDVPYNFNASMVGLTNVGAFVGSIFGMYYGGPLADKFIIHMSRKNKGVFEPEMRLWMMIIPTIINAGGLLAYGLPSYYKAHWAWSVVLGQGGIGFAMSASGAITIAYSVDCYTKAATDCLVFMLFIRNMIGFVFTYVFQYWLDACGLKLLTWLLFMISVVINGGFVIFLKWGKAFRKKTAAHYERISRKDFLTRFFPNTKPT